MIDTRYSVLMKYLLMKMAQSNKVKIFTKIGYNTRLLMILESLMSDSKLPVHIRQLVDKKNYVIAIKTHAEEQKISMEEAKAQIDAYEAQAIPASSSQNSLSSLQQGLDNHLKQENIKLPLIPRWVWRVSVILLVMGLLGFILYRLFVH